MSFTTIYVHDFKGQVVPVRIDATGDSKDIGDRIKAAVAAAANESDEDPTLTSHVFPKLDNNTSSPQPDRASSERTGIAPGDRDDTQIPSTNDLQKIRRLEKRNSSVQKWISSGQSSTTDPTELQDGLHAKDESQFDLTTATKDTYTEAFPTFSKHDDNNFDVSESHPDGAESRASLPTPDATPPATTEGEVEELPEDEFRSARAIARGEEAPFAAEDLRDFHDSVLGPSSNHHSTNWKENAAEWDTKSVTATVGSKKTIESIYDGTSIMGLSLSETKARERGTLSNKFKGLISRRSSATKPGSRKKDSPPTGSPDEQTFMDSSHTRGLSGSTLMPPDSEFSLPYLSTTNTDGNGYLSATDRRSSEVAEASGSTSPLVRLRRSFSKGEKRKSFTEGGSTPHLVGLIRKEGGPPVSTALVSPLHEQPHEFGYPAPAPPAADDEEEEEGDDDYDDDSDQGRDKPRSSHEELSLQIVPATTDILGFKDHALRLNPRMEPFLADRVAQEQVRRFKELKSQKIRHAQDITRGQCGPHCPILGRAPEYLPARINNKGEKSQSFFQSHPNLDALNVEPHKFQNGMPEPPVHQLPASFECSLCFKEKKNINKPSDWTKHVHEDLQPFTCTFKTCSTEKKSFKRKADWVRHENECHRHLDEWRCNFSDCSHVCYRSDNFSQHLIREHKVPDFKNKTRGSISSKIRSAPRPQNGEEEEQIAHLHRVCRSTSSKKPDSEACVFCGVISSTWKQHQSHLGKHMEILALPVLRLVEREEVSTDTIVSPIKREQSFHATTGSAAYADFAPSKEPQTLTPHSMNGSSYHPSLSASSSPRGIQPHARSLPPGYTQGPMNSHQYYRNRPASHSPMQQHDMTQQQPAGSMDGSTYGAVVYGANPEMGYLEVDPYGQPIHTMQADSSSLYNDTSRMHFAAISSNTPSTYPPPNLRRSSPHDQFHAPTSYPGSNSEYVNSPHSNQSYHPATTPSPHQMRVSPAPNHLQIPTAQMASMVAYTSGEFAGEYNYTEQPAPFSSPLEAQVYPDSFQHSMEAQSYMNSSTALGFDAMTATSVPLEHNIMYDQSHSVAYDPSVELAPHSQAYTTYQD